MCGRNIKRHNKDQHAIWLQMFILQISIQPLKLHIQIYPCYVVQQIRVKETSREAGAQA